MNYRSIADLADTIRDNLRKIPTDIDLVVGIPRSGILPAAIIAMNLNLKFCDLEAFLNNQKIGHGRTRRPKHNNFDSPMDASHILVVDDSVLSGGSIEQVKTRIADSQYKGRTLFCSIYAAHPGDRSVDLYFEKLDCPRSFEWNMMHLRRVLENACLDIDGVLCIDPTDEQNDDGARYRDYILNARPLVLPSCPIGHLVTSRLEKYRSETEAWLVKHGLVYKQLHMLDLPDAVTRRRLGCHASFKAKVYRRLKETTLFVESEPRQAESIAAQAGKPVLCFKNQKTYHPGVTYPLIEQKTRSLAKRVIGKLARLATK